MRKEPQIGPRFWPGFLKTLPPLRNVTYVVFFAAGMISALWAGLIPSLKTALNVDEGVLGTMLLGLGIGSLVMMPVTGRLVARWGCRAVLRTSLPLMAVFIVTLAFTTNVWLAAALVILFGGALGVTDVSMNVQSVVAEKREKRAILSGFHAAYSFGGMSGGFFFAALIVFQIPDIYRLCDGRGEDNGISGWNVAACVVGLAVMVAFLFLGSTDSDISLAELDAVDIVLLFIVGILIALSKIVPGLSGAAILLAIGLYTPLMDLVGGLDMSVILERAAALVPIAAGVVVGAIGLAKVVNHFMTNNRRSTYYCILGMTAGSVVTVTVQALQGLDGMTMVAASVVGVLVGLAFGYVLRKVSVKYARETISSEPGPTGN